MSRKLKIALSSVGLLLLMFVVLWYPYKTRGVPEWQIQVLDINGKPLAGVEVNEEWLDPIRDGIVLLDVNQTDASGRVIFPKRVRRNQLISGIVRKRPSARVYICWQDQYGDVDWDGVSSVPPARLTLKKGSCPYG